MPSPELATFVAGLPKAELHVHHVGSASLETVAKLAQRHEGTTRVPADPEALADFYAFTDFAHFIDVYLAVVELIRDPEDIRLLTYDVARDLAAQNVRYAELTLTPDSHVQFGIPAAAYCEAVEEARVAAERDFGIVLRWCFDVNGGDGVAAADRTLDLALQQQPAGLISFGLGGAEAGAPRSIFAPAFDRARAAGLHSAPHAGESTGPASVWESVLLLGAERIGHGIASAQDPALMTELIERDIVLEVCPTSNVRTRVVADLDAHPLRRLVEAGVRVTINSDDPPMFGTTLNAEYGVACDLLGLDAAGAAGLARESVTASFAPADIKARLLAEIDAYAAGFGPA